MPAVPRPEPDLSRAEIGEKLCEYLGCEKVLWLRDGIDPDETNGHIDDVACFGAPGGGGLHLDGGQGQPFLSGGAGRLIAPLSQATDAKGRRLKVHKLCLTREPCRLEGAGDHRRRGGYRPPVKTAR